MDAQRFGAVGDGQHDDTEALQHALTDGDGTLHLRKGTYRITRPLSIDLTRGGYGAVMGDGGTTRLVMDGPGPALRVTGDHNGTATPASVKSQIWERERFPTISGLEILGNHARAVGIELRRTLQATVAGVLIRRCQYGIQLVERNRNFLLSHSHIYDNHEFGVFFDRCDLHQTIISANHISYNKRAGIKSLGGDVHNLHITGNDIEYNNHPGVDESLRGEPVAAEIWFDATAGKISEVSIASNTIQATITPGGANIRIHGEVTGPTRTSPLISITGNVIGSQTRAIELQYVQRVTITGNTIYDSDDLSILARHSDGMVISGNTIVWRADASLPERDGIRLEDCENVVVSSLATQRLCAGSPESGAAFTLVRCRLCSITDCQVIDPQYCGIELEDCHACRIQNNTVSHTVSHAVSPDAVRLVGRNSGILVSGNLVHGRVYERDESRGGGNVFKGNHEVTVLTDMSINR